MEKSHTLNCGDINLTAALMSVGVPLSEVDPCSLVLRDNGKNYARFHVCPVSIDGAYNAERLMDFWRTPSNCNDASFATVMAFVKAGRDNSVTRSSDWLDYAHTYIEEMGGVVRSLPASIADITDFIANDPETSNAHIFAFVYNRDYCWQVVQKARRRIMITRGNAHAAIDTNLAKWRRNELLARLEG